MKGKGLSSLDFDFNIIALCNCIDLFSEDLSDGLVIMQASQRGAEFIELSGFALTRSGRLETRLCIPNQLTDHNCYDEKNNQHNHIGGAMHRKHIVGLYEKIIECQENDQSAGDTG